MNVDTYLKRLAARSPVPGGGSAAALVGAIGISLLSMVARYTPSKPRGRISDEELKQILRFTSRAQSRLRKLILEDEKAYLNLSRAIKKRKSKGVTQLYKKAANVPMEVCRILEGGLKMCGRLSPYCSKSLTSDLREAAILMEAGFLSAKANVEVNLSGTKSVGYVRKARRSLLKMEKRWPR